MYLEDQAVAQVADQVVVQVVVPVVVQAVVPVVVLAVVQVVVVTLKKEAQAAFLVIVRVLNLQESLKVKILNKGHLLQAQNKLHQKVLKDQVAVNKKKKLFKLRMEKKFGKSFLLRR